MLELLQKLVLARAPSGDEQEVKALCRDLFTPLCHHVFEDKAGNLIGKIEGRDRNAPPIRLFVHMDEIALIVKRIEKDGRLRVLPLGGFYPSHMGQGAVEILGTKEIVPGVLSYGSAHTSPESKAINKILPKEHRGEGLTPEWQDLYVVTRKSEEALEKAGVRKGTRVVIAKARRTLFKLHDAIAGYFMDNRAAIAASIRALEILNKTAFSDLFVVASTCEEIGAHGASFASRTLPGEIALAIDVGPVAEEYQTELSASPIIVYHDAYYTYDKALSDTLYNVGVELGLKPQSALFSRYGSDASISSRGGNCSKAALIAIPTENTHGYEIIHEDGIEQAAKLTAAFLQRGF